MNVPSPRPEPRRAGDELLVLQRAEALAAFVLQRTARWPKPMRHTLTRRLEDHVLDVVEELVVARYRRQDRLPRLDSVNLKLERARFLLRLAAASRQCPPNHYEGTAQRLDEVGRLLHGWRARLRGRAASGAAGGAP
jgi:hypothetical protein